MRQMRARLGLVLLAACASAIVYSLMRSIIGGRPYAFGSKSPFEMTMGEESYLRGREVPVVFNTHAAVVASEGIQHVDLNGLVAREGAQNNEHVLLLTPLRNAAPYLPKYMSLLAQLSYPHHLIDLGFLVSDCDDDTLAVLAVQIDSVQKSASPGVPFRSVTVVQKDFGADTSQDVEDRHAFAYQAVRRKMMGRARNYLLSSTLGPDHAWVMWRDADIVESPASVIEDLQQHNADIIVPSMADTDSPANITDIWFHRLDKDGNDIEGRPDMVDTQYNSWIESADGLKLASTLSKDIVLAEGYPEYTTNREYMARMGNRHEDPHVEIELDGIGGVTVLVKADVHRSGVNFPAYAFENQAETEGFAKMAKRAGYRVVGLPNYVVWHIDTEEKPRS